MSSKFLTGIMFAAGLCVYAQTATAQGMAVNATGAAAASSAILDVSATTQGMLMPRLTGTQRTSMSSPATGLLVYQTDGVTGFYFYDGSSWQSLSSGTTAAGGDLAGAYPNPTIASGAVTPAKMSASSGTAGSSTFYRGDGAWSNVDLGADVSGNLPVTNMNGGSGAGGTTYWRGDGTWAVPTGGSGTVTSVSAGNLAPLFTTSVSTATTTPAISYTLSNASAYTVLTNSTNATAAATYGNVVPSALQASSGTASSSTYYRGDGSWQSVSAGNKVFMQGSSSQGSGATVYTTFPGSVNSATNVVGVPMPTAVTITGLYIAGTVKVTGTPANAETYTLYKNGSATALTTAITIPSGAAVGSQQFASSTGSVSFAAGDVLSIRIDQTSGATGPIFNIGFCVTGN